MKVKVLKGVLDKYPDDMEVVISYQGYEDRFSVEGEFAVLRAEINHCTYTTKWESNVDYYSFVEETCVYADQINGKKVDVQIPMQKKEVLVLEV